MNSKKLLSLWGLKWEPVFTRAPLGDGLLVTPKIDHFRLQQVSNSWSRRGLLVTGEPGTAGKSKWLR